MTLTLLNEWLEKQSTAMLEAKRRGLVPQSGDWEHPYRWVRPEEVEEIEAPKQLSTSTLVEGYVSAEQLGTRWGRVVPRTPSGEAPTHLYRVMDKRQYDDAVKDGKLKPAPDGDRRIYAAGKPSFQYAEPSPTVLVAIEYSDDDGWKAQSGLSEVTATTENPISISKVKVIAEGANARELLDNYALVSDKLFTSEDADIPAPEITKQAGAVAARERGLVPQSGDWEKPYRWVTPEEVEVPESSSYEMPKYDFSFEAYINSDENRKSTLYRKKDYSDEDWRMAILESPFIHDVNKEAELVLVAIEGSSVDAISAKNEKELEEKKLEFVWKKYFYDVKRHESGDIVNAYNPPRDGESPPWVTDIDNALPDIPTDIIHIDDVPGWSQNRKYNYPLKVNMGGKSKEIIKEAGNVSGVLTRVFTPSVLKKLKLIDELPENGDSDFRATQFGQTSQTLSTLTDEDKLKVARQFRNATKKSLEHRNLPEKFYVYRGGAIHKGLLTRGKEEQERIANTSQELLDVTPTSVSFDVNLASAPEYTGTAPDYYKEGVGEEEAVLTMYEVSRDDVLLDMPALFHGQTEQELIVLPKHLKNPRKVFLPKIPKYYPAELGEEELQRRDEEAKKRKEAWGSTYSIQQSEFSKQSKTVDDDLIEIEMGPETEDELQLEPSTPWSESTDVPVRDFNALPPDEEVAMRMKARGLVWKPETHRWIRPEEGEESEKKIHELDSDEFLDALMNRYEDISTEILSEELKNDYIQAVKNFIDKEWSANILDRVSRKEASLTGETFKDLIRAENPELPEDSIGFREASEDERKHMWGSFVSRISDIIGDENKVIDVLTAEGLGQIKAKGGHLSNYDLDNYQLVKELNNLVVRPYLLSQMSDLANNLKDELEKTTAPKDIAILSTGAIKKVINANLSGKHIDSNDIVNLFADGFLDISSDYYNKQTIGMITAVSIHEYLNTEEKEKHLKFATDNLFNLVHQDDYPNPNSLVQQVYSNLSSEGKGYIRQALLNSFKDEELVEQIELKHAGGTVTRQFEDVMSGLNQLSLAIYSDMLEGGDIDDLVKFFSDDNIPVGILYSMRHPTGDMPFQRLVSTMSINEFKNNSNKFLGSGRILRDVGISALEHINPSHPSLLKLASTETDPDIMIKLAGILPISSALVELMNRNNRLSNEITTGREVEKPSQKVEDFIHKFLDSPFFDYSEKQSLKDAFNPDYYVQNFQDAEDLARTWSNHVSSVTGNPLVDLEGKYKTWDDVARDLEPGEIGNAKYIAQIMEDYTTPIWNWVEENKSLNRLSDSSQRTSQRAKDKFKGASQRCVERIDNLKKLGVSVENVSDFSSAISKMDSSNPDFSTWSKSLDDKFISELEKGFDLSQRDPGVPEVFDELYKGTQFGNMHTRSKGAWEKSSSTPWAGLLKESVGRQFDDKVIYHDEKTARESIDDAIKREREHLFTGKIDSAQFNQKNLDAYVRLHKNMTRSLLDEVFPHDDTFEVFRGSSGEVDDDNFYALGESFSRADIKSNSLSSYSLREDKAQDFADGKDNGIVINVPELHKDNIWSTFWSHSYEGNERELLVINHKDMEGYARRGNIIDTTQYIDAYNLNTYDIEAVYGYGNTSNEYVDIYKNAETLANEIIETLQEAHQQGQHHNDDMQNYLNSGNYNEFEVEQWAEEASINIMNDAKANYYYLDDHPEETEATNNIRFLKPKNVDGNTLTSIWEPNDLYYIFGMGANSWEEFSDALVDSQKKKWEEEWGGNLNHIGGQRGDEDALKKDADRIASLMYNWAKESDIKVQGKSGSLHEHPDSEFNLNLHNAQMAHAI